MNTSSQDSFVVPTDDIFIDARVRKFGDNSNGWLCASYEVLGLFLFHLFQRSVLLQSLDFVRQKSSAFVLFGILNSR